MVRIVDGNVFVLSDDNGDIEAAISNPSGFFDFDSRFLSLWRLSLDGERLHPLSIAERNYFTLRFFLVPGEPTHYVDAKASVIRERAIAGGGFEERLTVLNHDRKPVEFTVRLDAASDFSPLHSVEQGREREREPVGRTYRSVEERCLRIGYRREKFHRQTVITSSEPADFDEHGLTYTVRVLPKQGWT
ncbi:amylo-alpha-1,6-glucosidase, partial [Micromonospora globispora]